VSEWKIKEWTRLFYKHTHVAAVIFFLT